MANFGRIRLLGFWVTGSVVDPEEFEALDAARPKLINAADGSTHAPTNPIIIGGAGATITGPSILNEVEEATLVDGCFLTVNPGAIIEVEAAAGMTPAGQILVHGDVSFTSGATLEQAAGSTWALSGTTNVTGTGAVMNFGNNTGLGINSGAVASVNSGGSLAVQTGGTLLLQSGVWPSLSSRTTERHSLDIACTKNGGGTPDAYKTHVGPVAGSRGDAIATVSLTSTSSADYTIVEFKNLPIGATIVSVDVESLGLTGTSPTYPTYQIVRWVGSNLRTALSTVVTDDHVDANWTSDKLTTNVPTNGTYTVDAAYRYGVVITHPYQASVGASFVVYDCKMTLTATSMRV